MISVIIKGAIVSRHAPSSVSKKITRVHSTYRNPDLPANVLICPRKGAEVPDLNALELCKTWGSSGQLHIKSMFLGQNKYICGRFGGHMDTVNKKNAIWRAQDAVKLEKEGSDRGDDFFHTVGSTVIEVQVKVEDGVRWYFVNMALFFKSSQVL